LFQNRNLTQASLGATFFGDQLQLTPSVVIAAALAPLGLYLLAQTPERRRASLRRASASLSEAVAAAAPGEKG
jgi:hypothetical protein